MEISFKDITRVIKKNIVFILIVSCLFAIISVFVTTFFIQKTYTSSVKLYVETNYNTSSAMEDNQSVNYAKNLVLTYIELLDSNTFYSEVSKGLHEKYTASQLKTMIKFESIEDTEVFKAIVVSPSPYESKEIGDSIAKIAPKIIANVKDNAKLKIVDEAETPKVPTSPNVTRNTIIAFLGGLILALIISFVRDFLDVKIKYNEEMTTILDLPILAAIPDFEYFSNQKNANKYGNRYGK
ncbi:YveK family protein [Ruminococcus sp.]|jgi:capsular polysaccharide biosynthesis protein|uniref:YveK family protein n=1 Tax=Ruminococcus sp. TaxID=41978 RepID=UPI0035213B1D